MLELVTFLLSLVVVIAATAAVELKQLMAAVICFSLMGVGLALLFVILQAPDVAMAEASIGAGLVTAVLLITLNKLSIENRDYFG